MKNTVECERIADEVLAKEREIDETYRAIQALNARRSPSLSPDDLRILDGQIAHSKLLRERRIDEWEALEEGRLAEAAAEQAEAAKNRFSKVAELLQHRDDLQRDLRETEVQLNREYAYDHRATRCATDAKNALKLWRSRRPVDASRRAKAASELRARLEGLGVEKAPVIRHALGYVRPQAPSRPEATPPNKRRGRYPSWV